MSENKKTFAQYLQYLRQLLYEQAITKISSKRPEIDADWAKKLDASISDKRESVRAFFRERFNDNSSQKELTALQTLLIGSFEVLCSVDQAFSADTESIFTELCTLCPAGLISSMSPAMRTLEPPIYSNQTGKRETASHAYGLLAAHGVPSNTVSIDDINRYLESYMTRIVSWQQAVGAEVNKVHGAILTTAFTLSRLAYVQGQKDPQQALEPQTKKILVVFLESLVDLVKNAPSTTLQDATYEAFGQLSAYYLFNAEMLTGTLSVADLIGKMFDTAKKGNEEAIKALGRIAMTISEGEQSLSLIIDKLFNLHEVRQLETHFTVGEALSCLAMGWSATFMDSEHDFDGPYPAQRGIKRQKTLATIVDRVLKDCKASKPSLRKAATIWLLCLVQFCGHHADVQQRLRQCQAAFTHCLSDRDELVQEAASRGLGLVYEKGDRNLKDDLVRDLVGSFTDNKAQLSGNVTEDTQLFEAGALPTGQGESVTTYKDILSLASEVGDSSLVYRFMSLASNNAIWSSRAAFGRFGLSSVFSDSSVDGYLAENPKLYPKLFRYRFDPNPNVRRSMNDIWSALVKDSSATVERHFDAIIEDLLNSILGKEWRVREACCAAIANLVQSQKFEKVEKYLGQIWTQCFKVLDDIKGSVRTAAASLARVLTGVLTRSLEAGNSSARNADAMLKHVLPFLLSTSGLESSAEEVQAFSLNTLLEIIKKSSGKILRPFIPELVERLIGLFSSLENQA
ncbi:hypothetical protein LTS18_007807, partial [Coniosporium uncinatum]